jgi:hypothetical protein
LLDRFKFQSTSALAFISMLSLKSRNDLYTLRDCKEWNRVKALVTSHWVFLGLLAQVVSPAPSLKYN